MQTARDLVGIAVELATGMQYGHNDLGRRLFLRRMHIDRNTTTVVFHRDRTINMNSYRDFVTVSGQTFINGVIHHFIDQMVQTLGTGRTNIHGRPLTNCGQSFKNLDALSTVFFVFHLRHKFLMLIDKRHPSDFLR